MINVIIGGLIALAGQCLMWFITTKTSQKEILSRERKAQQYLAAQLIITLDEYVGDCYNTVQDPLQEDKDGYTRATVPDPTLTLPEGDYSIFETQLMYSILRLPSKNRNTVEGLPDFYDDPPSYDSLFRFRREQFSELGLLAASVVKKLCMEYRLPMPEKDSHYKPEDTFQECISVKGDIGELKRRRREAYAYRETQEKVGTA
ncbi:hypothetical protein CJP16_19770 [Aeromonas sobria]|uniref:Uncharacterized protein n=1 Tax=Aeromonas sobria TaxID=646 RepID=A0A2N3IPY3_AERSO|nr:hypothetical protein [Aeromonas sobria]PKQ73364.1 hypothetical protein CJP16_19770 [Aeromonas sobria]